MNKRQRWIYGVLLVILWGMSTLVQAQGAAKVQITKIDASAFPEMKLQLLAAADDGTPLTDFSTLQLTENGNPIASFETSPITQGIETVFVIDANATINQRDTGATLNRREQVRDSIVAFAQQNMNPSQLDRIHLLVPNAASDAPEFLTEDTGAVFANELINKINFYVPTAPKATPLNEMMLAAIDKLAASDGQRYRAIILFTDGGSLDDQLAYEALISEAQAHNITFYGFILGSRADANEIENVDNLTQPTGGLTLHMPAPADSTPLFLALASFSQQTQINYRSTLANSGNHTIAVTLNGQTSETVTNLTVEPPSVQILLDNSQPIIRVAPNADTPLEEMEPLNQLVAVQVSWPDNHPRQIAAASLLINGVEQELIESPTLGEDNRLEFTWNISGLDAGAYDLTIVVADELNLTGQSDPLSFNVEIERPESAAPDEVVETNPDTEVTNTNNAAANEETTENGSFLSENAGLIGIILGVLAIGFAVFLIILAFILMRRRGSEPAAASPQVASPIPTIDNADATQILMPAFAVPKASATLEPLEYASEHRQPIVLAGSDITIGRDPAHAKIVFNDKSVSRLHARIRLDQGKYVLIDEGSASGTYVNFERVGFTPQQLKDSDDVHIGRVHLRFQLAEKANEDDKTQIFGAPAAAPVKPTTAPADEDMRTEYYQQQPQIGGAARPQSPSGSSSHAGSDADDVSTQPYMPHQPKR